MFTTRPEIRGTFGVVASTHWLASAAGMGILERGGNAFDAAAAAGLVLQVVEPHLNGPLGDLPILLWSQKTRRAEVICAQGPSPKGATMAHYRDHLGLDLIPGTGLLAACVPGAFDGWMRMLRDYGTMRLADVLAPALGYAENGYPLVARIAATIQTVKEMFLAEWPSSAAIYLPNGKAPIPGKLFRNTALAATYRRVLREAAAATGREAQIDAARNAWYRGFVAEAIDRFCRTEEVLDASGRRHKGVLTADDMASWEATVEAPLTLEYRNYTVAKCGVWSQGPLLLQALSMLKGIDMASMDPTGPDFVHTVVEALKLAMIDRDAWYADPNFVDVPAATLLSDAYAAERSALIGETASHEMRPGAPDGRTPRLASVGEKAAVTAGVGEPTVGRLAGAGSGGVGEPTLSRDGEATVNERGVMAGDTCHVDVIDGWGNMVSATPSGGWLQSSPVIPELGFGLGTRAQMFWLEDGLPASLAPGRRPRTTLSPSFAFKDGEPYMPFGTPGGDQQDQWQTVFFLRHADHKLNLQEAIDTPSFHTEHVRTSFYPRPSRPGVVVVEGRMPEATVTELRRRGHIVEVGEPWSEGRLSACAAEHTAEGTILKAGANPRGMQGYAVGR